MKINLKSILSRRRWLTGASGFCAISLAGDDSKILAQDTPATLKRAKSPKMIPKGLRVFTCGHSFHVWAAPMIADMAAAAGIMDHQVAGISSIGGSRVIQHWDMDEEKNQARRLLKQGEIDVLTLSPIWLPDEGIEKFAKLGFENNADIRITVQEYWLPNDAYNPVYPLETKKVVDHNAATIPELRKQNDLYRHDIEEHVRELNRQFGKTVLYVVPVGNATVALREKIVAHKVPGLKVQWRLFTDDWGHPTAPLKVLAAYCHYAVIYRQSPIGLPMPPVLEQNKEFAYPALNRLLQELAWEAVVQNPMSGCLAD